MAKKDFTAIQINRVEMSQVPLEDYVARGMELVERQESIQWELGDLANDVTLNLGPKHIATFAKQIRKPVSSLRRYRDVARKFDPMIRQEYAIVPWSIFRDLCKYDRQRQENVLKRAAEEGWSYEKFKEMMKDNAIDDGGIVPPKPELKFCATCRKWYIVEDKELCPNKGVGPCEPKKAEETEGEDNT